jgi:universal stress protein A
LATDFSRSSELACKVASSLASSTLGKLIVVHVEPGQPTADLGPFYSSLPVPWTAEVTRRLVAVAPENRRVPCEHRLLTGEAAVEIVRQAAEDRAELIVMGSRGWGAFRKLLVGSVAESVLRNASCPVIICRLAADSAEQP